MPLKLNCCSSDLKRNLPNYATIYLTPPTLLEILASSLTNILPSLTKLYLSKACYYSTRQLRCIRLYLDSSAASTIAISIVYSKFNYYNYICKSPKSQLSRLHQIQNSLARTVVKAPTSCHMTPIYTLSPLAQNHWTHQIQASSAHLPTKFWQLPNLYIFITSFLFSAIEVLALYTSLVLLGHRHHPLYK